MISGSPDSGSFPFVKKVPNSSNWSIWFSLNNSNLLVFWTIPFVAKSLYILAPLLPPLSTLAELRWCLTGCSPHLASDKALTLCVFSWQFQSLPGPDVLITALYCLEQPYIWTHDLLGVHLETKCKYLAQFLLISRYFNNLLVPKCYIIAWYFFKEVLFISHIDLYYVYNFMSIFISQIIRLMFTKKVLESMWHLESQNPLLYWITN